MFFKKSTESFFKLFFYVCEKAIKNVSYFSSWFLSEVNQNASSDLVFLCLTSSFRLCASNIYRFNERKWLHRGKKKEAEDSLHKLSRMRAMPITQPLLANTSSQTESQLHSPEWAAGGIGLHMNADKTENMCFNQRGNISTLKGGPLKLVDKFTYLGNSISSTENDINTWVAKTWTAIDRLSVIWKSDMIDKVKHSFFQTAVLSILLYGCTTWTLTKCMEKKLDGNYTRMQQAVWSESWRQHPTKQQLYGHLPPITKTIQIRWTRHAGHNWRSNSELISDVLLWTHSHGQAKVGWPARTYLQQLCADTGCSLENLLGAMDDRDEWQERIR